jgi:NADPH-dependent F420 reductase
MGGMNAAALDTVAVVGGTGKLGFALARRWAHAGIEVIIGSRDATRAAEAAARIRSVHPGSRARGAGNRDAAAGAAVVVVAVPYSSQQETLSDIRDVVAGKVVIDTTVPLMPPKVMRVQLPTEGCAANRAQALLGPDVRLVSAFHNVAAHRLESDAEVDCDVLVFGDDRDAREYGVRLAVAAGLRGLHAGVLANSAAGEAMTSVLIFMNKFYAADGAGVRVTGVVIGRAS